MKRLRRILVVVMLGLISGAGWGQTFLPAPGDSTTITEYFDGHQWAYQRIGDVVVGLANYKEDNKTGTFYQLGIMIQNLGTTPITFDPDSVTSSYIQKNGKEKELKVYTYEQLMKKIEKIQMWTLALNAFSAGWSAGEAGRQQSTSNSFINLPTYSTYNAAAASSANIAAQTQLMTLSAIMENNRKEAGLGYLKMTTVHPSESIVGIMNADHKKGKTMTVNITINGTVYSFDWDITKKKKKK